jgi:epidermal growth factor receptor substrate 15
VTLSGREHGYYSNLFTRVDPQEEGKVGGKEAVTFFKSSGLPKEKLKEIWMMASYTSQAFLTKEEFYVALRLIAYA